MAQVLFAADSATKAQRLSRLFAERGIGAAVQHLPVGLTTEGCAYAVAVSPRRFEAARMLLRQRGISVRRVFFYDEISLSTSGGHSRSMRQMAWAAIPSPLPVKPRCSSVVALTLT